MMKILIAPDKFKGSLPAREVCAALAKGIARRYPGAEVRFHPMADGGDGTLSILAEHQNLRTVTIRTEDPLGRPMEGKYLLGKDNAFIEVATASGLVLLPPEERNPLQTSSWGTGLLLADALRSGVGSIYLLLGGSATHDVGTGIAKALGFTFHDKHGMELLANGSQLEKIQQVKFPDQKLWHGKNILLFCDVTNPLTGPRGSALVYAAQKGADEAAISQLERGTIHFGHLLDELSDGTTSNLPGGGAAGGIGAGLHSLLGATLRGGFQAMSNLTNLKEAIRWADHIITGEGRLDDQSLEGKVVGGVMEHCVQLGKPCSIVVGKNTLPPGLALPEVVTGVHEIMSLAKTTEQAMTRAAQYLEELTSDLSF